MYIADPRKRLHELREKKEPLEWLFFKDVKTAGGCAYVQDPVLLIIVQAIDIGDGGIGGECVEVYLSVAHTQQHDISLVGKKAVFVVPQDF